MDGALKRMMDQGLPQFHLPYTDLQNKDSYFVLHFNKFPGTDQYYFEKFEAVTRPSLDSLLNQDKNCQRYTFSQVGGGMRFSAQEADRIVNGKCVFKDGDWQGLMFANERLNHTSLNIEQLPQDDKAHLFALMDAFLRDHKAKKAYAS
jgi:hypothetical protein